jgi:hypothetical protein
MELQLVSKINEANDRGWVELVEKIDAITQTLTYPEYNRQQVREEILNWCEEVNVKLNQPPPEPILPQPLSEELFGTEV